MRNTRLASHVQTFGHSGPVQSLPRHIPDILEAIGKGQVRHSRTLWDILKGAWSPLEGALRHSWRLLGRSGTLPEASKAFQDALEQFQADNTVVRTLHEALDRRN